MATLIQSKQIEGIVTASVIQGDFAISGSLNVSGSGIFTNDITASGIISGSRVLGVNYDDISGTPTFNAGAGILITQVGDTITITNTGGGGDGVSDAAAIAQLNAYTASNDIVISGINQTTASLQSQINALVSATSSYITTDNTGSDSQTLSIVGDQLTISDGNTITIPTGSDGGTSDFTQLTNVPSGLVSSSEQILGGSGILSGSHPIGNLNDFTQSADVRITNLENFSSSLDSTFATDSELSSLSSSIATTIDNIQHTQIPSGVISGSTFTDFSSSVESRLSTLEGQTDLTGSDTQSLSIVGNQLSISDGNTVTIPTGSDLPSGLISSSQQISDFGYVTSSLEAPFNGDRVVSNTLLGELYSQSYNAGTTGSLAEFIEQVFFPVTAPTAEFTDQTVTFNTNLATNNTNLVSVSLTDTVDNSPYTLVLSGTNASSLTAVPTNAESSSWEIRANGDLTAGTYSYNVTVGDSTDATRIYSGRSIVITQSTTGSLTTTGTLYIIESATNGVITLSNSGIPGSTGGVSVSYSPNYGSQVATNFSSSNSLIDINSTNGLLSVGSPISGSGNIGGDTITTTITYNDQYGNSGSADIDINVTENSAPDIVFSNSSLLNTNQATGSSGTLVTLSFVDSEGDSINHDSFTFTDPSGQLQSTRSGNNYLVTATSDLSASNYTITASIEDVHGFRTNTETHTFTINSADDGTLTGDTSIYIVESALTSDSFRDATGFGNGNLANISVSYSPNYGSQVGTLSSSNPAIVVDGSGNLTLGVDLSGSVTQSGDSFTSLISWTDQYGNSDSSTITATVFGNQSPSATFTDLGLTDVTAVSGSNIGSLSITDTESNSPFQVTIGGTDGGKFNIIPQNAESSSWIVQPTGSLSIGDYSVQFTVTDSYSEQAILNETISVTSDSDFGVTYIYTNNRGLLSVDDNYLAVMGGVTTVNGDTPPEITSYSDNSIIDYLAGSLGSSEIDMDSGFNLTQRLLDSGSDLGQILSGSNSFVVSPSEQILIIFPSGSDMVGIPTSIGQTFGGSTTGEYVLNINTGAGWSSTIEGANIHSFQTDTPVNGYSEYFIIGTTVENGLGGTIELRLTPSSGSAPV